MGVCTKGFVLTPCKDVLLIAALVQGGLDRIINDAARKRYPRQLAVRNEEFRTCKVVLSPSSGLAQVGFTYDGEVRMLWLFFDCDCDNVKFGPQSISMSLGCNGRSELFMRVALHALSSLGPAYLDLDDGDDVGPALLDEPQCSMLDAVGLGYLSPYQYERLLEQQRPPGKHPLEGEEHCGHRWKALKDLAEKNVSLPSFLQPGAQVPAATLEV